MTRMCGPKRKKFYAMISQRDGECCFIGGEPGNSQTLLIDHANNDNGDNRLVNLHLICPSMNTLKNPRGRARKKRSYVCVSEDRSGLEPVQTISPELKKNQQSEPDFRHWLFGEIWRKGKLPLGEVIDCGAAIARCSQETIKRYLRKESSRVRLYEIVEDLVAKQKLVQFRPEWERLRKKEEERRTLDRQASNWREDTIKDVLFIEKDTKKKLDERIKRASDEMSSPAPRPP